MKITIPKRSIKVVEEWFKLHPHVRTCVVPIIITGTIKVRRGRVKEDIDKAMAVKL